MIYNHPALGDYNTEALIFKMAAARFLDVSEEETNKMEKHAVDLSNYSKTIILLVLSEYCRIIIIRKYTEPSANNCKIVM